ncbi:unnamed protein product [Arabidopsis arenosa]|uniref:Transposase-associated domain-containing protein n=1 Tax=Arabidopsis arenosa TaxID=38785 RepID=A0A8S2ABR6_ARAAE|nr:unnamed protein product [Arabidopsis arenosa]
MDKSWVWLPRTSLEYEQGATDFVNASARKLGNPPNMFCPCIDCRNVCHQPADTIIDHLVIRDEVPSSSLEAYELFRTAFYEDEENLQSWKDNEDQPDDVERTLGGCKVKGKQECNVCGKDTPFRWLKFSRKNVYMGNRKRLSPGHPYRRKKVWFDNSVEEGFARRIQTSSEIFEMLKDFRNDFGKPSEKKSKRKRSDLGDNEEVSQEECEEDLDKWRRKKLSILFELPYWKYMPVRHNIDVMHVEKNVSDFILSILMQSAKLKEGLKARQDLEDMGIRSNLHTQVRGKKKYLPPAAYWLSKAKKKKNCKRLSEFRGPDGYCANIGNCVSLDPPTIGGLKSHDHHVLLQNLLPVALRETLPRGPRIAVTRICKFFNKLCQRVIDPEMLLTLEAENSVPVEEEANRNKDVETDPCILEGRPLQRATEVRLTDKERKIVHRYVLMNTSVMNPYVE